MMSKEGSNKSVNLMTAVADLLVLGRDHTNHIVKMRYFFKKSSLLPGMDKKN